MLALLFLLGGVPQGERISLDIDGQTRQALVFRPAQARGPVPVLFGFHGHMGNSFQASKSFGLEKAWPNALVIYPQGLPTRTHYDPQGRFNGWHPDPTEANTDVHFFDALYQKAVGEYGGDPRHVFVMGHSNGGQFVYILWALRPTQIAGVGSYESTGGQAVKLTPKPFFITIGSLDATVNPRIQEASLRAVFRVNGSSPNGQPYGEKGMLYPGIAPVVVWRYEGGHQFPKDAVPSMVSFFQSVR